ncbi:hypothetical protein EVAR_89124_1 [Eumeta japonica]|uniref:Uncharacterized protein n=1 Tax=Eumeta variegata TaxID=151549 RepID=A0A4C1ZLN3_EUMVA|nr:hypothetical protein EVAR_89124_1 [Eumeta japonica]
MRGREPDIIAPQPGASIQELARWISTPSRFNLLPLQEGQSATKRYQKVGSSHLLSLSAGATFPHEMKSGSEPKAHVAGNGCRRSDDGLLRFNWSKFDLSNWSLFKGPIWKLQ